MTYSTERQRSGREPVTIVEMDLDYCALSYGSAPCTAAVGTTGERKCFNTRATCQDPDNYDRGAKTYRSCTAGANLPASLNAIPSLLSVDLAPTRIEPGKGLGERASISLTFEDHAHHDQGIDKYVDERDYDPQERGTYWGKLRARNPYYQGRTLRVYSGYITDPFSWDAFEQRTYVLEQIDGPSGDQVSVTAKDPLKLADDDRALCPRPSNGRLLNDRSEADTAFVLTPLGVGSEYPSPGFIRVGSELMSFTRAGDTLTVVRGQRGTEASEHRADSAVQLCYSAVNQSVPESVSKLLTDFAGLDAALIPLADWEAEAAIWLAQHKLNTLITEPFGVRALLDEICEQCMLSLWWDERTQTVKFRPLQPPPRLEAPKLLSDEANIVADSPQVSDDPERRASRVVVYFAPDDPTQPPGEKKNYRETSERRAVETEAPDQYGQQRIREFTCRWFGPGNRGQAIALSGRSIARLRDNPRQFRLALDAKDTDLWTGDVCEVETRHAQDATGAAARTLCQIISVNETQPGTRCEYLAEEYFFRGRYGYIGPNTLPDYDAATAEQRRLYGFIAPNSGTFADGTEAYKII